MAENIKPTRSELLKTKNQIRLAKSGHALLKKKRDGLILEFFDVLNEAKTLRQELTELYKISLEKINIARTLETDLKIKSIAMAIKDAPEISIQAKNIMGIKVPKIESGSLQKHFLQRGYGYYNSASIDEAALSFESLVEKIILAAEIETSMRKLLKEIEKTKRRVNALEFSILPKLQKLKGFISLRLEEIERENLFRMKRIKGK